MTAAKAKFTPDAIEALRQLHARDPYDAAFIAAILELRDRQDALAKLVCAQHNDLGVLKEIYHTMSDSIDVLTFLSRLHGARADADEVEKIM
jgi:hypothetical protein